MKRKPVVLMILDGYGLSEHQEANAVYMAKTPVMDQLMKEYPFQKGNASGLFVGLPDGQMGNSEVGHMNMGGGRIIYQDLTNISRTAYASRTKNCSAPSTTVKRTIPICTSGACSPTAAYTATTPTCTRSWSSARDRAWTESICILSSTAEIHRPRPARAICSSWSTRQRRSA